MELTYVKDVMNQNYIGVKINPDSVDPYLTFLKNYIYTIYSPDFEKADSIYNRLIDNQKKRDHNKYHLTFLNVSEYNDLLNRNGYNMDLIESIFDYKFKLEYKGVGTVEDNGKQTFYIIVECKELNSLRVNLGFNEKDFHITLGFDPKDIFNLSKGLDTIIGIELLTELEIKLNDLKYKNRISNMRYNFMELISNWNSSYNNTDKYLEFLNYNSSKTIASFLYNKSVLIQVGVVSDDLRVLTISETGQFKEKLEEKTVYYYTSIDKLYSILTSNEYYENVDFIGESLLSNNYTICSFDSNLNGVVKVELSISDYLVQNDQVLVFESLKDKIVDFTISMNDTYIDTLRHEQLYESKYSNLDLNVDNILDLKESFKNIC